MSSVVAYVVDLMDRSKMTRAAGASGIDITFVRSAAQLADALAGGGAASVVVDLGRPDAIDAITAVAGRSPVVGYGSHVDTDRLQAARHAGAATVLARSAFFSDPARWMRG
ncbi:MAG: hypothetical protein ACRD0A_09100 [Acidimicrobiales bacterium]